MKKALLLVGDLRILNFNKVNSFTNEYTFEHLLKFIKNNNFDVFLYTRNTDFFFNDVHYFNKKSGENIYNEVTNGDTWRVNQNYKRIDSKEANEKINIILSIFKPFIKDYFIEEYERDKCYHDPKNENHTFYLNSYQSDKGDGYPIKPRFAQAYKVYECFVLHV